MNSSRWTFYKTVYFVETCFKNIVLCQDTGEFDERDSPHAALPARENSSLCFIGAVQQ